MESDVIPLLNEIINRLDRLERHVDRPPAKEWYTTEEVASLIGKSPWTVRQACNTGRIEGAKKVRAGRGRKGEWRVSHAAVERLQNEGLLHAEPAPADGSAEQGS